tara:strand:- start:1929 stop:3134 length:1206 start_codon:yes stop_codon:yes gene_type:complete
MATPSIQLIPSAVKAGTVYSILPTNGIGDFDFTRAGTATKTNKEGLIETVATGVPRLDYSDGSGCPSLLLEPQSTNELNNSNGSDFTLTRSTRGSQLSKIGVDGFEYSFTSSNPKISKNYAEITLGYKTLSFFIDSTNSDVFRISLATGGNGTYGAAVTFTPSTKTFGVMFENTTYVRNSVATYKYFGNNIFKLSLTVEFILYNNGTTYTLIDFGSNSNVWIGGLQVEKLPYPTSYIPTSGTTQTRVAETLGGAGDASSINSEEGVLYAEILYKSNDSQWIMLSDGTTSNSVVIELLPNGNLRGLVKVGNVFQVVFTGTSITLGNYYKVALKYKLNDFSFYVNGVKTDTDTTGNVFVPNTLNNLSGYRFDANINKLNSSLKDIRVYKTVLTDAELQALTTQ